MAETQLTCNFQKKASDGTFDFCPLPEGHKGGHFVKELAPLRLCNCWAGTMATVRMTTKLAEQRAKCLVHGGKRWPTR